MGWDSEPPGNARPNGRVWFTPATRLLPPRVRQSPQDTAIQASTELEREDIYNICLFYGKLCLVLCVLQVEISVYITHLYKNN